VTSLLPRCKHALYIYIYILTRLYIPFILQLLNDKEKTDNNSFHLILIFFVFCFEKKKMSWLRRTVFVAIYITLIIVELRLSAQHSNDGFWQHYAAAPDGPWCERGESEPLSFNKEPWNARSDFLFLAVGLLIVDTGVGDWQRNELCEPANALRRSPSLSIVFGLLQCVHAFGTYLNHASRTFLGWQMDVVGMYLIVGWTFLYCVTLQRCRRRGGFRGRRSGSAIVSCAVAAFNVCQLTLLPLCYWMTTVVDVGIDELLVSTVIVVVYVALTLVAVRARYLEWRRRGAATPFHGHFVVVAFASFAVAFLCWFVDFHFCESAPPVLRKGHALWHVLSSAALLNLYWFVRAENYASLLASFQ
jgi:Ceramidase